MRSFVARSCLFLSGAAGLVYELCWIRRASLAFGSTTLALSTVLAVFFLGLALGSQIIGRRSASLRRPLIAYAWLEAGVAVLALLSLPAFGWAESAYGVLYRAWPAAVVGRTIARVLLATLVLLPPALLMGGTLPLFTREFTLAPGRIARSVGGLYALNTLGAALGCLLTGAALIPTLGLRGSILVGAMLSLVAALGTAVAGRAPVVAPERARSGRRGDRGRAKAAPTIAPALPVAPAEQAERDERPSRWIGALAALTGFVALGNEVLWARYLGLVVTNTVLTYTVTIGVVLAGIVLGSAVAARLFDRVRRRDLALGALQVALALVSLGIVLLPPAAWEALGPGLPAFFLLLLPPAVLSGAIFPLLVRMEVDRPAEAGPGTGRIVARNTAGGILGSLVTGFALLPLLGLMGGILVVTGLSLLGGLVSWLALTRTRSRGRWIAAAAGLVAWLALPAVVGTRVPADFLGRRQNLVAWREGRESNLSVVRIIGTKALLIDRQWQGQDRQTHQAYAGHIPMLLHPGAKRVLVVGAGAGQAASRFTMYDLEHLDCVDIEPAVFDMIRSQFDAGWMRDPRVRIVPDDGRELVVHGRDSYDVISIEIGQLFRPGAGSFYTTDFYRRARARLAPGGVVSQFLPIELPAPLFRSLVASFLEVFPNSVLWYNTSELLLIGINGDRLRVDPSAIARGMAIPAVHDDMDFDVWGGQTWGVDRLQVLLGGFLCGPAGLSGLARGAPPVRDDRPIVEYLAADAAQTGTDVRPTIDLLRQHLDPLADVLATPLAADTLARIAALRERHLGHLVSMAILGDLEDAAGRPGVDALAVVSDALRANPDNAKANRIMGDLLADAGRWPEAERSYAHAAERRDRDALAHLGLGRALLRRNDATGALAHFERAQALGGGDLDLSREIEAARAAAATPAGSPGR